MLRRLCKISILSLVLLSSCASTQKQFKPMAKCWVTGLSGAPVWTCLDSSGAQYEPTWNQVLDLEMFPAEDFKGFQETCHEK